MKYEKKILITDRVHPLLIEGLQSDGFVVDYEPKISADKVLEVIPAYEGLLVNSRVRVNKEILDRGTRLRFTGRIGSGLEVIDLEYAKQKKVAALNAPEGNRNAVAEHALAMLLNLLNNISKADREIRNYEWKREENRGYELAGKTIGLIAYGNNAQAFSKILKGFDVKVLAYDKYLHGFSSKYVTESSLETIFAHADVLSLHLPLTPETQYMIDYRFLSSFSKPIWFINISRGKVLRTWDMLRCISEGKILGAALDVLENEKLTTLNVDEKKVFDALINERKVLLSPHIAGWTHESKQKIAEVLLMKIRKLF